MFDWRPNSIQAMWGKKKKKRKTIPLRCLWSITGGRDSPIWRCTSIFRAQAAPFRKQEHQTCPRLHTEHIITHTMPNGHTPCVFSILFSLVLGMLHNGTLLLWEDFGFVFSIHISSSHVAPSHCNSTPAGSSTNVDRRTGTSKDEMGSTILFRLCCTTIVVPLLLSRFCCPT